MSLLDIAPLLSSIIGALLCLFILFKKTGLGKSRRMRNILALLVFMYTFVALDYYLIVLSKGDLISFGMSGVFFHLTGFLFYYFIVLFTKNKIRLKLWIGGLVIYTLMRWTVLLPILEQDTVQEYIIFVETTDYKYVLYAEFVLTSMINIVLSVLAFFKLQQTPTVIDFNEKQSLQYRWIKLVLLGFIVLQLGIFINNMVGTFDLDNFETNLKTDTLLIVMFFFVIAFSMMHFPVFAFSGDFEDLPDTIQKKYVKSSLTDSYPLFSEIDALMRSEALYLDFDLKLNTVAERLDKSVHHISQAINQNAHMSFPDYINGFRIEAAKQKLLEPKPDTIFAISLDVGFNSKAAFYAAFKKVTSQTPTEFKRANKTT